MIDLIRISIFIFGTAVILFYSWSSLHVIRSHGFYRFFVWEFCLSLIALNLDVWFVDPFSSLQIISWILLFISIFLVFHSVYLLRKIGKPQEDSQRDGVPVREFEKTTSLVTSGAYRFIRHPLYSSLLFLAYGAFLKNPTWIGLILVFLVTVFLVFTARFEEAENIRFFGPEYYIYIKKTRMFIPFIF